MRTSILAILIVTPAFAGILGPLPQAELALPELPDALQLLPTSVYREGRSLRESFHVPQANADTQTGDASCEPQDAGSGWDDARPLAWPTVCTGHLAGEDYHDRYALDMGKDDYVEVQLTVGPGAVFDVCFLTHDGWDWDYIACATARTNTTARIQGGLVDTQWYVTVSFYDPSEGNYTLRIHHASPPGPQDDCGTGADAPNQRAAAVPIAFPAACAGYLPQGDAVDWYAFDLAAGEYLEVGVASEPLADVDLCVFAPTGETYGCSMHFAQGHPESHLVATEDLPGRWLVAVDAWESYGNYTFSAARVPPPAPQSDCGTGRDASWRAANASAIAYPLACEGRFDAFDRLDWFTIPLAEEEYLALNLTPAAGVGASVCTISPRGYAVECGATPRAGGEAGDWRIAVYATGARGSYQLAVAALDPSFPAQDDCGAGRDASDRWDMPTPVAYPVDCTGIVHALDRLDYFSATVPTGTWLRATLRFDDGSSGHVCISARGGNCRAIDGEGYVQVHTGSSTSVHLMVFGSGSTAGYRLTLVEAPPAPVQDDCGRGGDAPYRTARLTIAATDVCEGLLSPDYGDYGDDYLFRASGIHGLRVTFTAEEAATICLNSPYWWDETCRRVENGTTTHELFLDSSYFWGRDDWKILVRDGTGRYSFDVVGLYKVQDWGGCFLVGHNATEGRIQPDAWPNQYCGIDGDRVHLAAIADGSERLTAYAHSYDGAEASEIRFEFRDAAGEALKGGCVADSRDCTVPAGASSFFVTADTGVRWGVYGSYRYLAPS